MTRYNERGEHFPPGAHQHNCPSYGYSFSPARTCICFDDWTPNACQCNDPEANLLAGLINKGLDQWVASYYLWGDPR